MDLTAPSNAEVLPQNPTQSCFSFETKQAVHHERNLDVKRQHMRHNAKD